MIYDIYVSGILDNTACNITEALNYINSNNLIIIDVYELKNIKVVKVYCEEDE